MDPPAAPNTVGSYVIPEWSAPPSVDYALEVVKGGAIVDQIDLKDRECFLFGRQGDICDVHVQHGSISRQHAVIQFSKDAKVYLTDIGSTHGTFVNKKRLDVKKYQPLNVGDVIQFGESTRFYHLVGPESPDIDRIQEESARALERIRERKQHKQQQQEQQQSASWGMSADSNDGGNDNLTPNPDDGDAGDVPDYIRRKREKDAQRNAAIKGTLDRSQVHDNDSKLFERLEKKREKADNIQLEIDRIRVKETQQMEGLSEGQQRQIDRNNAALEKIQQEIASIEETIRGKNSSRLAAGAGGRAQKVRKHNQDESLDTDNYYDNTDGQTSSGGQTRVTKTQDGGLVIHRKKRSAPGGAPGKAIKQPKKAEYKPPETYESLCAKIAALKDKQVELITAKEKCSEKAMEIESQLLGASDLDKYMFETELSITNEKLAKVATEIHGNDLELKSLNVLLDVVKPSVSSKPPPPTFSPKSNVSAETVTVAMAQTDVVTKGAQVEETFQLPPPAAVGHDAHPAPVPTFDAPANDRRSVPLFDGESSEPKPASGSMAGALKKHAIVPASNETPAVPEFSDTARPKLRKAFPTPPEPAPVEQLDEEEEWVPPADQTGDGITALNAKYGY